MAADVYRPAAIDQLCVLGASIDVPVHTTAGGTDPVVICADALDAARADGMDPVILDTAGRLHVDDDRMGELKRISDTVSPGEILFVADGMTGQDAVSAATAFYEQLTFTGVVLTRLDSDTRGGAALSIREVTGVPIKYAGVSEKMEGIEPFHPGSGGVPDTGYGRRGDAGGACSGRCGCETGGEAGEKASERRIYIR